MQETQEMRVWSLGQEDPLEKGVATHSGILEENPMDRGVWRAEVHGVTKSQTQLKWLSMHTCTPGKRGIADVIELKILRWEEHSGLSRWNQ